MILEQLQIRAVKISQFRATSSVATFLHIAAPFVRIRLTKKLAEALNGFDLRAVSVGEVVDLSDPLARMLLAERWAEEIAQVGARSTADDPPARSARSVRAQKPRR